MTIHSFDTIGLLACGGILLLGFLVLFSRAKTPLSLPLGLLCLSLFGWNFAMVAYDATGADAWRWIDNTASPLSAALTLQVVLVFTGAQRRLRWLLCLTYAYSVALALAGASAFVSPAAQRWIASDLSSLLFLALLIPLSVFEAVVLVKYLRVQDLDEERMRARLVLAALAVGALLFSTELWNDFVPVPSLGQLGALLLSLLMTMVVLRLRKIEHMDALRALAYAGALGAMALFGYALVVRYLATHAALALLGAITLTALLGLAASEFYGTRHERRRRERQLVFLGRFSDQLAHDLKNPLAALKGAVDFLLEEHRQQRPLEAQLRFVELIHAQACRIEHALEGYRRFGQAPTREEVNIGELIVGLAEGGFLLEARERGITLETEVDSGLEAIRLDGEQLRRALENLLRNALDALETGGKLEMSAHVMEGPQARKELRLRVCDNGCGMDARQLSRAADEFYSTKGSSGLGLAFARRVTEAHGGKVVLSSTLGRGTTVDLLLPMDGARADVA
ncbi:MAG: HAMP domain-containing histidine kinase [Deltaproteobacteria bacterium]|nr:HAMP domain-containing histidine kinase [Deltaproteobacteria bacterium]